MLRSRSSIFFGIFFGLLITFLQADPLKDAMRLVQSHIPPLILKQVNIPNEEGEKLKVYFKTNRDLEKVELTFFGEAERAPLELDIEGEEGKEIIFWTAQLTKKLPFALFAEDDQGDWLVQVPPSKKLDCQAPGTLIAKGIEGDPPKDVRIKEIRMAHDLKSVMIWYQIAGKIGPGYVMSLEDAFAQGYALAFLQGFSIFGFGHAPLIQQIPFGELADTPSTFLATYEKGKLQFEGNVDVQIEKGTFCIRIPGAMFAKADFPYFRTAAATFTVTSLNPFRVNMPHRSNFSHVYFLDTEGNPFSFFKQGK